MHAKATVATAWMPPLRHHSPSWSAIFFFASCRNTVFLSNFSAKFEEQHKLNLKLYERSLVDDICSGVPGHALAHTYIHKSSAKWMSVNRGQDDEKRKKKKKRQVVRSPAIACCSFVINMTMEMKIVSPAVLKPQVIEKCLFALALPLSLAL